MDQSGVLGILRTSMADPYLVDPVVVIGCFRSGTSSVAMALSALGAYFGEPTDFSPPDEHNREGYWEHKPLLRLNRAILATQNVAQFDIDFMPEDWDENPLAPALLADYKETIQRCFGDRGIWGWKDPETTLVLPLVKQALKDLGVSGKYVLCVRNPLEVAESERKRIGADPLVSIGSWMQHILFGLYQTLGQSVAVVSFDDLLADQATELQRIVAMNPDWKPTQEEWAAALATQRRELVTVREKAELSHLPALVSKTYDLVLTLARDGEGLQRGFYDETIRHLYREYEMWLGMLHPQDPPKLAFRVEWPENGQIRFVQEMIDIRRSWKTISLAVPAPVAGPVRISLFQMPGNVWIRKAEWILPDSTRQPAALEGGTQGHLVEERGTPCLWPRFGSDQIRSRTPKGQGPYILELEVMVTTHIMSIRRMWQGLSDQIDQLAARSRTSFR